MKHRQQIFLPILSLYILFFPFHQSLFIFTDMMNSALFCETEVKLMSPSPPPSIALPMSAPDTEAVLSAATCGVEEPHPTPSIPNKLPTEGKDVIT